jgi:DNA-3-methyladenine glycosylase I
MAQTAVRCFGTGDPLMEAYHDHEWGVPEFDDRALFEKLILDGFQAGLSWRTILHKREAFRRAFRGFEPERIAAFGGAEVERLISDAGIVRNRAKIEATIGNADAYLVLRERGVPFSEYLWSFTGHQVIRARPRRTWKDVPVSTEISDRLARDLKDKGFRFVGTTTCYAFMQAVGMVDDHLASCFRYVK